MSNHSSDEDTDSWSHVSDENEDETHSTSSTGSKHVKLESEDSVSLHHHLTEVPGFEGESLVTSSATDDEHVAELVPDHELNLNVGTGDPKAEEQNEESADTNANGSFEETDFEQLTHSEMTSEGNNLNLAETLTGGEVPQERAMDYPVEMKYVGDSDSDHSDFVRLDPMAAEEEEAIALANMTAIMNCSSGSGSGSGSGTGEDVMKLSDLSTATACSSFRFIHRSHMVLGAEQFMKRRLYRDDDAGSVQSDVDDRCESDISGVADDDELSAAGLGDLPISAGNVVRSYKHRPNADLNRTLTTLALVVLFGAVGIGVGHFMGFRSDSLRRQQEQKIKTLSDDYLMCLLQQEESDQKLASDAKRFERLINFQAVHIIHTDRDNDKYKDVNRLLHANNEKLVTLLRDLGYEPTSEDLAEHVEVAYRVGNCTASYCFQNLDWLDLSDVNIDQLYNKLGLSQCREKAAIGTIQKELETTQHELETALQDLGTARNQLTDQRMELDHLRTRESWWSAMSIASKEPTLASDEKEQTEKLAMGTLQGELDIARQDLDEARKQLEVQRRELDQFKTRLNWWPAMFTASKEPPMASDQQSEAESNEQTEPIGGLKGWQEMVARMLDRLRLDNHSLSLEQLQTVVKPLVEAEERLPHQLTEQWLKLLNNSEYTRNISLSVDSLGIDEVMNRTKQSMSDLSQKINETWHQVKDIPGEWMQAVLPDTLNQHGQKFVENVESMWNNLKIKFTDSWLGSKKEKSNTEPKRFETIVDKVRGRPQVVDERKQYHGDPYWNTQETEDNMETADTIVARFENKPDHKKRQSTIVTQDDKNAKKYEEFWGAVGFDPDAVFHDDFAQGNERKYRNHERRVRKLYGRIRKLNEEVLNDMDNDEVEDLYEDLDEAAEDLEPEVQPSGLSTWLSCQIRWWKSRFQRKHRDEGLLQGCGRQLMHWQIRSSCKNPCKNERRAQRGKQPTKDCRDGYAIPVFCLQNFSPDLSLIYDNNQYSDEAFNLKTEASADKTGSHQEYDDSDLLCESPGVKEPTPRGDCTRESGARVLDSTDGASSRGDVEARVDSVIVLDPSPLLSSPEEGRESANQVSPKNRTDSNDSSDNGENARKEYGPQNKPTKKGNEDKNKEEYGPHRKKHTDKTGDIKDMKHSKSNNNKGHKDQKRFVEVADDSSDFVGPINKGNSGRKSATDEKGRNGKKSGDKKDNKLSEKKNYKEHKGDNDRDKLYESNDFIGPENKGNCGHESATDESGRKDKKSGDEKGNKTNEKKNNKEHKEGKDRDELYESNDFIGPKNKGNKGRESATDEKGRNGKKSGDEKGYKTSERKNKDARRHKEEKDHDEFYESSGFTGPNNKGNNKHKAKERHGENIKNNGKYEEMHKSDIAQNTEDDDIGNAKSRSTTNRKWENVETRDRYDDNDWVWRDECFDEECDDWDEFYDDMVEHDNDDLNDDLNENDNDDLMDQDEDDTEWLFERARDLEYRLHKSDWVFERAKEREFIRTEPDDWFHERKHGRRKHVNQ